MKIFDHLVGMIFGYLCKQLVLAVNFHRIEKTLGLLDFKSKSYLGIHELLELIN